MNPRKFQLSHRQLASSNSRVAVVLEGVHHHATFKPCLFNIQHPLMLLLRKLLQCQHLKARRRLELQQSRLPNRRQPVLLLNLPVIRLQNVLLLKVVLHQSRLQIVLVLNLQ